MSTPRQISSLRFSPCGRYLAAGSWDQQAVQPKREEKMSTSWKGNIIHRYSGEKRTWFYAPINYDVYDDASKLYTFDIYNCMDIYYTLFVHEW